MKVSILGQNYKIVERIMDNLGECDPDRREIYLNPNQSDVAFEAAAIHEIVHASLYISGLAFILDEKLEEAIVRVVEHSLAPLVTLRKPLKRQS